MAAPTTKTLTKEEKRLAAAERREAYRNEKVTIQLPKDNQNYKDDVTVCVNGKIWQIQRGKQIAVPRKVANVLRDSSHQETIVMDMIVKNFNVNRGDF